MNFCQWIKFWFHFKFILCSFVHEKKLSFVPDIAATYPQPQWLPIFFSIVFYRLAHLIFLQFQKLKFCCQFLPLGGCTFEPTHSKIHKSTGTSLTIIASQKISFINYILLSKFSLIMPICNLQKKWSVLNTVPGALVTTLHFLYKLQMCLIS